MTPLEKVIKLLDKKGQRLKHIPLPDDKFLDNYEKATGIKIPVQYREYLKLANNLDYGTKQLFSVSYNNYSQELKEGLADAIEMGVPAGWFPFCSDNGDFYCIANDDTVRFWSHDGSTDERWINLVHWINDVWCSESTL